MQKDTSAEREAMELSPQEKQLLALIRSLKFGELHLYVADGKPVRAERIKQSIKF